jgi:inner membrane protein involved in colicin E2 resistance
LTQASHSASIKAVILAGIAILLLVPLSLLGGLVAERTGQRAVAVQSMARGWGDRQWISGPLIAIPVTTDSQPARKCDWESTRKLGVCYAARFLSWGSRRP